MGWFQFARDGSFPTNYKAQHTPAHTDVFIAGLITAILIVAISFFAVLPAYSSRKRKVLLCRIFIGLVTGGIVLIGNYGPNWEIGTVKMTSPYRPHSHEEINGTLSLHVSLRGINITMTGKPLLSDHNPHNETSELAGERIDYNEKFSWEWRQGRFGFGYYAGQISKDFRAATERGVPLPILQVAEYFTFDGEGIRFGRYYRLSGWYCHLLMWTGFATWLISNILFCMVVSSGAYFLILTGLLQLTAISIWTFSRNPIEIQIPFQSANEKDDVVLSTQFGLDYYLVLGNGVFCALLGVVIIALDSCIPDEMCQFFGIDPLTIYEELHLSDKDVKPAKLPDSTEMSADVSRSPQGAGAHAAPKKVSFHGDVSLDIDPETEERESLVVLKRKTNMFQRSFRIKPKPAPRRSKMTGSAEKGEETRAFLTVQDPMGSASDDDDDDDDQRWPSPPRESLLKRPPTPPPKHRQ